MQFVIANDAEDAGDAETSIAVRRQTLEDSLATLATLPEGSADYFEVARQAIAAGYRYGWSLSDNQQLSEADRTVAQLWAVLQKYDLPTPPPAMVAPLAQFHWLQSRRYKDAGNDAESRVEADRVYALTKDLDVYPGDYIPLARLRFRTLWDQDDEPTQLRPKRMQACELAEDIFAVRPDEADLMLLVGCDLEKSSNAKFDGKLDDSTKYIYAARDRLAAYSSDFGSELSISTQLRRVDIELAAKDIASFRNDQVEVTQHQLSAIDIFSKILNNKAYFQNSTLEIGNLYTQFKDIDLAYLPEYADTSKRREKYVEIFTRTADAVEASRRAYPNSPSYAIVAGDSWARIARYRSETDDLAGADEASAKAVEIFQRSGLIASLHGMDERAESECMAYDRRVLILVALSRSNDALEAYRAMDRSCGDWVRKYPWEFYARQYVMSSAWRLGVLLHHEHRFAEAAPLLKYASDWGDGSASFYLADMFRMGHGVPADVQRADALYKLAGGQSMKRFTVPTSFNGMMSPFNIYALQYPPDALCPTQAAPLDPSRPCAGYDGVDDQVLWVKELRGGVVSADVVDSFRKLAKIARDNNVSLPELAVYALGVAQKEQEKVKAPLQKPPAAPSGPPPVTAEAPTVTVTDFVAMDWTNKDKPVLWQTRIVPFQPGSVCFGWRIGVTPEFRTIELREDYLLPSPPEHLGSGSDKNVTVTDGGRRVISRFTRSLQGGEMLNSWCPEKGDPLGGYRIQVFAGEQSLADFEFELVPPTETAPPSLVGQAQAAAQAQPATTP